MPGKEKTSSKAKNFKGTGLRMLKDFKSELPFVILIVIFAIASAILTLFSPILINDLLSENSLASIFNVTNVGSDVLLLIEWSVFFTKFGTLLLIYMGSALIMWLSEFFAVGVSGRYAYRMREKVQRKLNRLPLSYFDRVPYGDTLSIVTNDIDNISRNLQTIITQVFSSVTLFVGAIIAMFVVSYQLALVAIASLPFTIIIVIFIGKFSGKKFEQYRNQLGELNGKIEEDYSGYKIIKLFNKEEEVEQEFEVLNDAMRKTDGMSQFLGGFIFPATNFINNLAYVAIAVVAGILENVAGMVSFFLFLNCFTRPFQQLGQIFATIQSVVASGERIYSLLDEEEVRKDAENPINSENEIKGKFKFDNVYFQYTLEKPLIENFSLTVNPGDTVAIVGPTGAGKTTMVNLIMRFYEITNVRNIDELKNKTLLFMNKISSILHLDEIQEKTIVFESNTLSLAIREAKEMIYNHYQDSIARCNNSLLNNIDIQKKLSNIVNSVSNQINDGNIYLDDRPLSDYSTDTLRSSIGMVLQDTWLFKGTIRENLLYGDQNATEQEIINACKEAHIDHFINTLPGGYNFMLNEEGTNISQGQRQLLTIARAILSKPKIMILDEATSSVDTRTEQQIQDALDKIMKNKTSFVIAHRLSTIKKSKLIIVMKKGHIVEIGNHKELLKKGGFYADLYNSQFAGVNPMQKEENIVFDS